MLNSNNRKVEVVLDHLELKIWTDESWIEPGDGKAHRKEAEEAILAKREGASGRPSGREVAQYYAEQAVGELLNENLPNAISSVQLAHHFYKKLSTIVKVDDGVKIGEVEASIH